MAITMTDCAKSVYRSSALTDYANVLALRCGETDSVGVVSCLGCWLLGIADEGEQMPVDEWLGEYLGNACIPRSLNAQRITPTQQKCKSDLRIAIDQRLIDRDPVCIG